MTKLEQAAEQLLEAIEDFQGYRQDIDTAIADLREALDAAHQPAAVGQEPVGFMNAGHLCELENRRIPYVYVYPSQGTGADVPVYTAPQVVAVDQEPVALGPLAKRRDCCWSHLDETGQSTMRLQTARQPLSELPDGDIVFFSDRGDAVTGYSAQRVWEILRAHGIGGEG